MKLLSKDIAESKIKKENETLIDSNIRLREYYKEIIRKLNTIRENYDPEKLKILKEFEVFCKDILNKKSKLLQEITDIEKQIESKKEVYYGLVIKQDELDEKMYKIKEEGKKLDLRQSFVEDLEEKWKQKNKC